MKKTHILVFAMFVVMVFSAVAATAAFAESEWLVNGATIDGLGALPSETEGLVTFKIYKSATSTEVLNEFDCEAVFDGTITTTLTGGVSESTDSVTEILNLEDVKIVLGGTGLSCPVTQTAGELGDCELNSLAIIFPNAHLPWATKVELVGGVFKDDFPNTAGYEALCKTGLGELENACENALRFAVLTNETGSTPAGVLGTFEKVVPSGRGNCTLTGEHTTEVEGGGVTWATNGGSLTGRLTTAVS